MQLTNVVALSLFSLGAIAAPQGTYTYPGQPTSYPGAGSGGGYPGSGSGGYPGAPGSGGGYPGAPGSGGGYPGAPGSTSKTTAPQPTKASSATPAPATSSAPANPPAGGAPIFASVTFTTAASSDLVGGVIGATGGPAGGSIDGTAAYVTGQPQATGDIGGAFSGASGRLDGGANPTALDGCAGGEDSGFGFTQCVTAPLMPRATEAPRPSGVPGFFESFTYSIASSSAGANLAGGMLGATAGAAGGALSGTVIYQTGKPAATGNIGGADSGASGKLQGGANPTEVAGCAGGADHGLGFTQCVTAPLMARATAMPM